MLVSVGIVPELGYDVASWLSQCVRVRVPSKGVLLAACLLDSLACWHELVSFEHPWHQFDVGIYPPKLASVGIVGIFWCLCWQTPSIKWFWFTFFTFLCAACLHVAYDLPRAMSNFLFWSQNSTDAAAIAKALAGAQSSAPPRVEAAGPVIKELPTPLRTAETQPAERPYRQHGPPN